MPKRFFDTALWQKPWFRGLSPVEKAAWFYLIAACDAVGVYCHDPELADFVIGAAVDWEALRGKCNNNIEVLDSGKWWLPDFCAFQYGKLRDKCKPHQSYVKLLQKHGLFQRVLDISDTLKEKDKEKELEKDKEKEKTEYAEAVHMTAAQHQKLVDKYGSEATSRAVDKLSTYKLAKGRQYKSDYHAMLQWVFDAIKAQPRANTGRSVEIQGRQIKPWKCPKCGNEQVSTATSCLKCGEEK